MSPAPLFKPFRALGYITDNTPFAVQRRGKETFVACSVGKAWQIYNCTKLTLAVVGPQLKQTIRALACKGDLTFAAVGRDIVECRRVHRSGLYSGHSAPIIQLLVLGDLLLSLGSDAKLIVWKIGQYDQPESVVTFPDGFKPICMAHPDTYLNKVVVGSEQGALQLWNFATATLLYTFKGWGSAVRALVPSPALDVVAAGLADGQAVLHNLRYDEEVVSFANAAGVGLNNDLLLVGGQGMAKIPAGGGACTAISFRTGAGLPLMTAGGGAGVITVWNLEERKLHTVIKDAHDAPLLSLHFFPGEPLLMSSAADNSLKHWAFDLADGTARLLRFRSGHSAPPTCITHYGEGLRLLSAGQDRAFRVFSVIQDQQSRELSQGHTSKRAKRLKIRESEIKLPRLIQMDANQVRERDWANVITAHEGDTSAYTWRLQHFTIGEHQLRPPPSETNGRPDTPVTAVALSACGNFGVVGTAGGRLDRYNMQSGLHRGTYIRKGDSGKVLIAHDGAVVGVAVDSCNRLMVSGGFDKTLRIWNFKELKLVSEVPVGASLTHVSLHIGSTLCAAACDDLVVRMFDVEAARLVRRFKGHKDRITSMQISSDSRWLLSASMDGTLRVWDIPAARCLQIMQLGANVTSLSLSPALDLLATTHTDRRGIYLWANQLIFGNAADILHSEVPVDVSLPTVGSGQGDEVLEQGTLNGIALEAGSSSSDEESSEEASDTKMEPEATAADAVKALTKSYEIRDPASGAPAPIAPELVTLSLLPKSQWQSLVHLEAIKARNRPIQPPKKPEAAPFFLPTVPTLNRNPTFDTSAEAAERSIFDEEPMGPSSSSKVVKSTPGAGPRGATALESDFLRQLQHGGQSGDFSGLVSLLRGMSASAIDRELRAMQVLEGSEDSGLGDVELLLQCIQFMINSNTNFEFCQALLQLTLQVHGDTIALHTALQDVARDIQSKLKGTWARVNGLMQGVLCMVQYFGNIQG